MGAVFGLAALAAADAAAAAAGGGMGGGKAGRGVGPSAQAGAPPPPPLLPLATTLPIAAQQLLFLGGNAGSLCIPYCASSGEAAHSEKLLSHAKAGPVVGSNEWVAMREAERLGAAAGGGEASAGAPVAWRLR